MPKKSPLAYVKHLCLDRPFPAHKTPREGSDIHLLTQSAVLSPQSLVSRWLAPIILCLCFLTIASPALAHRVLVYAFAEGDTIHTESKFVGSGAVQKGQVLVQDKKTGQTLLTGTTDDQGKFSFKILPEAAAGKLDLLIVTEATMGHKGEWLLKADSYLPGASKMTAAVAPSVTMPTAAAPSASPPVAGAKTANVDQQALEEALNKVMERQLAPVKEMLTELTIHRTSLTDVVGGLGYIAGIFGLWAYFMSKKQPKS
jgi:nickel transport protein